MSEQAEWERALEEIVEVVDRHRGILPASGSHEIVVHTDGGRSWLAFRSSNHETWLVTEIYEGDDHQTVADRAALRLAGIIIGGATITRAGT